MIKILIIERQTIVAEGLRVLLKEETNFRIFLSNKDIKLSHFEDLNIDIILISLDNLDESDFAYLNIFRRLINDSSSSRPISPFKLIVYAEKVDEFILNKALQLDCQGYLLKDSSIEELKQAINSVYNGYKHIGNSVFTKIKQLSVINKSPNIILENSLINSKLYLNTDLETIVNSKVNYENNNLNNQQIEKTIKHKILVDQLTDTIKPQKKSFPSLSSNNDQSQQHTFLRNAGSNLLLVGWGCIAGVIGVFLVKNRVAESFIPIVRHGTVQGEIVTIPNVYSREINHLKYKVGDLVEAKEIVAEIESQAHKEKVKTIKAIANQIEKINNHIEQQKRLQAINQSNLNRDREKLEELLAENFELKSNKVSKQEKLTFADQSNLSAAQEEVKIAYEHYHKLQKLKQQKVLSAQEVERAKQAWKTSQNKLTQIQNLANFSLREDPKKTVERKNLQYIQENIAKWQTQISEQKNTIKLLEQDFNDAKGRLDILDDSNQEQQFINVKSPVRGVISQITINNNDIVNEDQTLMELVNCDNLWVEVVVNATLLEKINIQQPVLLSLEASKLRLSSKIDSIYPIQNYRQEYSEELPNQITNSQDILSEDLPVNESLFNIKIDFPIPDNYAQDTAFCGWKETATVVFNN